MSVRVQYIGIVGPTRAVPKERREKGRAGTHQARRVQYLGGRDQSLEPNKRTKQKTNKYKTKYVYKYT